MYELLIFRLSPNKSQDSRRISRGGKGPAEDRRTKSISHRNMANKVGTVYSLTRVTEP